MSGYLDKQPEPEVEFAAEIAAYEKEQAEAPPPKEDVEPPAPEPDVVEKPAVVAEVKPAPVVEDAEPDEKAPVPYKALKEERQRRQALEKTVEEMQSFLTQRREPEPAAVDEDPDIDPEVDPIGALQQERARNAALRAERQQEVAERQLSNAYMEDARAYSQQVPDFGAAYQHLVKSRGTELKALGYNVAQINEQIRREEMQLAFNAFQSRKSPAQVLYDTAVARGYTKAPPVALVKDAPPPTAEEIADLAAKKAAAAFSISPGGKPPAAGELSGADVAGLSGDDFDKGFAKLQKASKRGSGMFRQ